MPAAVAAPQNQPFFITLLALGIFAASPAHAWTAEDVVMTGDDVYQAAGTQAAAAGYQNSGLTTSSSLLGFGSNTSTNGIAVKNYSRIYHRETGDSAKDIHIAVYLYADYTVTGYSTSPNFGTGYGRGQAKAIKADQTGPSSVAVKTSGEPQDHYMTDTVYLPGTFIPTLPTTGSADITLSYQLRADTQASATGYGDAASNAYADISFENP